MAKYKSRYPELAFYVDGVERKFSGGVFEAKTADEEAVLNRLSDAVPDGTPEVVAEELVVEADDKPAKPAPKPRKTSAK